MKRYRQTSASLCGAVLLGALSAPVVADPWYLAVAAGRVFSDSGLDSSDSSAFALSIDGENAHAMMIGRFHEQHGLDWTDFEIYAAQHHSNIVLARHDNAAPESSELSARHLQLGGKYNFYGSELWSPFLGVTAGLSQLRASAYDDLNRFSYSFFAGVQLFASERSTLRLELRAVGILLSADSEIFCAGGCVATIRGDVWWQHSAAASWVIDL